MTNTNKLINVSITFRNLDAIDSLKNYATEKLKHCLSKFVHNDTEAHVTLKVEKNRQIAEATFHSGGADFHASEESDNMYASIDRLNDALAEQLRRHKDRVTSHH